MDNTIGVNMKKISRFEFSNYRGICKIENDLNVSVIIETIHSIEDDICMATLRVLDSKYLKYFNKLESYKFSNGIEDIFEFKII